MYDINAMVLFAAVVERRSFTDAAKALHVPKSRVSRRISELEAAVGLRLLQRTTRRVVLTEAGAAFFEHCQRLVEEVQEAELTAARLSGSPRGRLRVLAGVTAGQLVLTPLLPGFLVSYPDVQVDLRLSNVFRDPVAEQVDVIVTGIDLPSSAIATRRLLTTPTHLYASPAYLRRRREPRKPEDLKEHAGLLLSSPLNPRGEWCLGGPGGRSLTIRPPTVLVANDALPLVAAAVAGRGIVGAGHALVAAHVKAGQLQCVLPEWSGPDVVLRIHFPTRRGLAPKVRVFIDYLVQHVTAAGMALAPHGTASRRT